MPNDNPSMGNAPARPSANSANDTAWPKGFQKHLEQFAERTDTTPPARPFEGQGDDRTFSAEFLAYCQKNGLSLIGSISVTRCRSRWARSTVRRRQRRAQRSVATLSKTASTAPSSSRGWSRHSISWTKKARGTRTLGLPSQRPRCGWPIAWPTTLATADKERRHA